ncbi:MAG: PHP domain-containing protein, partial [Planctomycetota bacterium]|nr:PHP domain-containing protein [Planctomycetota bacterium]
MSSAPSGFVDLVVSSNHSFLRGASRPEELVEEAARLGAGAVAVTDRHSVSGIVRAHVAAKSAGIRLVPGTRVELWKDLEAAERGEAWERDRPLSPPEERIEVALHATGRRGWATICRLLALGKRRAPKGRCRLVIHDLLEHHAGILVTLLPSGAVTGFQVEAIEGLAALTDLVARDAMSLGVQRLDGPEDDRHLESFRLLSDRTGLPLVAQNDVHFHRTARRRLQDVLTCIRLGCTLENAGRRLHPGDRRRLRSEREMRTLFADLPEAIDRSRDLAARCTGWSLDELEYEYPSEVVPPGETPMSHLRSLVATGGRERFGSTVPPAIADRIRHEFELIEELDYARYFLTVHDIVRFARSRGILCQGRGAAANSAVCYCLGITAVDPERVDMLFERFISRERNEPPDIDVDFEHERREEVLQYVYERYGRDRAALVAEVISYRGRSAIRDVGTVLGLSADLLQRLSGDIEWWSDGVIDSERVRALGIDPEAPAIRTLFDLAGEILGFPRH